MRVKQGADCRGLKEPITSKFFIIEECYRHAVSPAEFTFVITCGTDSHEDRPTSLHNAGLAIDIRIWFLSPGQVTQLVTDLQYYLGPDYDVVAESDHVHIEADLREV